MQHKRGKPSDAKALHACIRKAYVTLSELALSTPREDQSNFGNKTLNPLAFIFAVFTFFMYA